MALSADTPRDYELGTINELPVKAATKIYEGAAVGDDASGYMRGLVAGDPFRGFAQRQADNSSGAAAAINVKVITYGLIKVTITGIAITDVGSPVYASADGTFTLTATSNSKIGYVHRYVAANTCIVAFSDKGEDVAADSKADSASTRASVADSKALSVSTIASTNLSVGDSKATSLSTVASANLSTGDSKAASLSTGLSTANSKITSAHP